MIDEYQIDKSFIIFQLWEQFRHGFIDLHELHYSWWVSHYFIGAGLCSSYFFFILIDLFIKF